MSRESGFYRGHLELQGRSRRWMRCGEPMRSSWLSQRIQTRLEHHLEITLKLSIFTRPYRITPSHENNPTYSYLPPPCAATMVCTHTAHPKHHMRLHIPGLHLRRQLPRIAPRLQVPTNLLRHRPSCARADNGQNTHPRHREDWRSYRSTNKCFERGAQHHDTGE